MSQMPSNDPIMESRPGPGGWLPVWIKAVTKPSEQTFVEITESPDATSKTAFIWVFIAGVISGLVQAVLQVAYFALGISPQSSIPGMEQFSSGDAGTIGVVLVTGLCLIPVYGLLSIIGFAIVTAIIQWVAKLFGGVGTFEKLAYGIAAISVPITLVSAILGVVTAIPFVGLCVIPISIGLGIYALVLQVMAVKAVNRFGWGPAIGSVLLPVVALVTVCICVVFGALMLMGPIIGDVFSEINQSLAP